MKEFLWGERKLLGMGGAGSPFPISVISATTMKFLALSWF
jgi:hypothetical protein